MLISEIIQARQPLKEGGNAIENVSRINQENVEATLADIHKRLIPKLNIKHEDTRNLGSTGKKAPGDSSGDIDLAISVQSLTVNNGVETPAELYDLIGKVCESTGYLWRDMRGIGIVSLGWPIANIDGLQENEFVQLDLMTVDSIDWAAWAYYSPHFQDSGWKGLYRNEIMYAVARHMNYKVVSRALDKEGVEVDAEWQRDFFDLSKGILQGQQSRIGKKGITKGVKMINKELKTIDPAEAVQMMFGPDFQPSDMLTWEDAFAAVTSDKFIYPKYRQAILAMTKQGILNKGYPVPPELDAIAQ